MCFIECSLKFTWSYIWDVQRSSQSTWDSAEIPSKSYRRGKTAILLYMVLIGLCKIFFEHISVEKYFERKTLVIHELLLVPIGNSMVSSAIWKKTCTSEFFKDYCIPVLLYMTKLCRIESYACITCKITYLLLIVNIFRTKQNICQNDRSKTMCFNYKNC